MENAINIFSQHEAATSAPARNTTAYSRTPRTSVNPRLLSLFAKEIAAGRPLWALLHTNEYLAADSLLRRALLIKARAALTDARYQNHAALIESILNGTRMGEFTADEQAVIRSLEAGRASSVEYVRRAQSHTERKLALSTLRTGRRKTVVRQRVRANRPAVRVA